MIAIGQLIFYIPFFYHVEHPFLLHKMDEEKIFHFSC